MSALAIGSTAYYRGEPVNIVGALAHKPMKRFCEDLAGRVLGWLPVTQLHRHPPGPRNENLVEQELNRGSGVRTFSD
jgi:hypothetical protein